MQRMVTLLEETDSLLQENEEGCRQATFIYNKLTELYQKSTKAVKDAVQALVGTGNFLQVSSDDDDKIQEKGEIKSNASDAAIAMQALTRVIHLEIKALKDTLESDEKRKVECEAAIQKAETEEASRETRSSKIQRKMNGMEAKKTRKEKEATEKKEEKKKLEKRLKKKKKKKKKKKS